MQNLYSFTRASLLLATAAILTSALDTTAQDLPKAQPKLLTIIKEQVKVGRSAAHGKFEAAYPAAFKKAKSPDYYLAMTSLTGPAEALYVIPHESHAAIGEMMKREHGDATLTAELNRLAAADAEYITGVQTIRAIARPDLSVGEFPDLSKARYFSVDTFRIRPGRDMEFEEAAKAYTGILKRVAPKASHRMYQVIAGMEQPTYRELWRVRPNANARPRGLQRGET
jgi:hypothetical protein